MSELTRRNFLTATLAGAGAAMILTPQPGAVQLFEPTIGELLAVTRVPGHADRPTKPLFTGVQPGETLFNAAGRPVVIVKSVSITSKRIESTGFYDDHRLGVGLRELEITVVPVPGLIRG